LRWGAGNRLEADSDAVRAAAPEGTLFTIQRDALQKVRGGRTTIEAVLSQTHTNREDKFAKTKEIEDPLLKVPPASRGNRTRARFPSRSGGNLQEGGNCKLRPCDWYHFGAPSMQAA
jgi:hypothetical protein